MDALGRGVDWGSMLSLVDGLLWPAKLPPSGVDFRPVCHHPHRGSVSPGEGGFEEILPPSPSQRHNCTSPVARYQLPDPQSGKSGYSNPEFVHPRRDVIRLPMKTHEVFQFFQVDIFWIGITRLA